MTHPHDRAKEPSDSRPRQGRAALLSASVTLAAAGLVKTGEVISLDLPMDRPPLGPPPSPIHRTRPALRRVASEHHAFRPLPDGRIVLINDDTVEFAMQNTSQWDALGHVGLLEPGSRSVYFGGAGIHETWPEPKAKTLGIDSLASGVATRGILLDMVGHLAGPEAKWLEGDVRIRRRDVVSVLDKHALALRPGDAVLVYTGFLSLLDASDGHLPKAVAGVDADTLPLWDSAQTFALISDNPAVEPLPIDYAIHIGALVKSGIYLGELWALEELVVACRAANRYEFLLVSVPLKVPGAFGSPPNAVAIL